jgi:hypothetical protein
LNLLSKNSLFFPLISALSLSSDILSSIVWVCWSGFQLHFLFGLRTFSFLGFLFVSLFWDFPYLC